VKAHARLPAGTVIEVRLTAGRALFAHVVRRHRRLPLRKGPLKVTPPLGLRGYVFPVAASSTFGDSYGAFRADVSGGWHHGDDIFAPLGAPVVAVADGTLNRVGWEPIGGWRLWVRDNRRNEFYYAHLSGYAPLALHSKRVRRGQVLGFVGNTGDAFTTPPHLHFEIHPHQLLRLDYDGAVDPTGYLSEWPHPAHRRLPRPVLPPLPEGPGAQEARSVFGRLLAARGLTPHAPTVRLKIRVEPPRAPASGPISRRRTPDLVASVFIGLSGSFVLIAAAAVTTKTRARSVS
jgi:hypothetical protein